MGERSMRTPLGRVRHHGAGHEGTGHFMSIRLSSIALAVIAPWFAVTAALSMPDASYTAAIDFLTRPLNAVGAALLVMIGLHHMALGMQEVVLDYIEKPFTKLALLVLNVFVPVALGAGALFALMLVNFGD